MTTNHSSNGNPSDNDEQQARQDWQTVGRDILGAIDKSRHEMIGQLRNLANSIRRQAADEADDIQEEAHQVAEELESTADRLANIGQERIQEVTERLSQNVWGTLLVAFLIGVIVGWLLSQD